MTRAVIDTNVVVSAFLKEDSLPAKILHLALGGTIRALLHQEILDEYFDVLSRKKFGFDTEKIRKFIIDIRTAGEFLSKSDIENLNEIFPDPKDVVFYQIVMEGRKTDESYLVTGNTKHFPVKPFVVTPKEMLDILESENTKETK